MTPQKPATGSGAAPRTPTGIEFAQALTTDSKPGKVRLRPIKEWIAAIEAEAASAAGAAAALDVERLAAAIMADIARRRPMESGERLTAWSEVMATAIFIRDEYATLSQQVDGHTSETAHQTDPYNAPATPPDPDGK